MTPSQRQLCQDNATFNQTIWGGAIIGSVAGAALGAIACALAHKNVALCAAGGAVVGGAVGSFDGYMTAKNQEAARQKIRTIDAVTADIRAENDKLRQSVAAAQAVVRDNSAKLAQMDAQRRANQLDLDQARAQRARIEHDKQNLDSLVNSLEQREQNYRDAGAKTQQSSPDYNAQIRTMETQIAQLRQQRDILNNAIQTTPTV
jgi:chromosome segregation ATPase